jgi:hypothetical protein
MSKKGGRPRKPGDDVRASTIGVRVSAKEREALEVRAREMGMAPGTWLRTAALARQLPRPPVPVANRGAYADLGKLGGILNQLARQAHHGGPVTVDSELLQRVLKEVQRLRLELLGIADDLSTPRGGV